MKFMSPEDAVAEWTDKEMRLFTMGGSFIAVQAGMVNLDDLLNARRPGAIVRCYEKPSEVILVVQLDGGPVGCVAGWVSEDE